MGSSASRGAGSMVTKKVPKAVEAHRHSITVMRFLGTDRELLVTASEDRTLRLWDFGESQTYAKRWKLEGLNTGFSVRDREGSNSRPAHRSTTGDDKSGMEAPSIRCPLHQRERDGHEHWITCVDLDVKFKIVYSGSMDRCIKAWDVCTGRCLRTYMGHTDWVTGIQVMEEVVYSSSDDGNVRLWRICSLLDDTDTDDQVDCWEEHKCGVKQMIVAADRVITADVGGIVKCWDRQALIQTGSLASMNGDVGVVTCMVAPYWERERGQNRSRNARGGGSGAADLGSGLQQQHAIQDANARAHKSSDLEVTVFVGGTSGRVRWLDVRRQALLGSYDGHAQAVTCLQVLDGTLITGSEDKTLRAWSVSGGNCLQVYAGHLHPVRCFVASSTGIMLSGGGDIRAWNIGTGEVLQVMEWQQRVDCLASQTDECTEVLCGLSGNVKGISTEVLKKGLRKKDTVLQPMVVLESLTDVVNNLQQISTAKSKTPKNQANSSGGKQ